VSLLESASTDMLERAAFFICGVVTVLIGRVYAGLQRSAPTNEISWSPFRVVLLIVGVAAICISLLPSALVRRLAPEPTGRRRSISPRFLCPSLRLAYCW
jgi:hypothetical protein